MFSFQNRRLVASCQFISADAMPTSGVLCFTETKQPKRRYDVVPAWRGATHGLLEPYASGFETTLPRELERGER